MSSPNQRDNDAEVWRLWQDRNGHATATVEQPDPILIAAYAENRLDETAAEPVEAWLADHPEAFEDVLFARQSLDESLAVSEAAIARACGLIAAPAAGVVPLRRPLRRASLWRVAAAWGGIAASVAATGVIGFALGSSTYESITTSVEDQSGDLLDPPTGFFAALSDDRNT